MEGASVILCSATPSMDSYKHAQDGTYRLWELTKRAKEAVLPKVYIEDLREELKAGNRSMFSRRLRDLIQDRLDVVFKPQRIYRICFMQKLWPCDGVPTL